MPLLAPAAQDTSALRINPERLWEALHEISAFGATENNGLNRVALNSDDGRARDYLRDQARELGLEYQVDRIGNQFFRRPGRDNTAPAVLIGSHLDSQPYGGRFDGTYGVIAGLEVLRCLDEHSVLTHRPVVLANWTNEEGSRFSPSMFGSAVFAGRIPLEPALQTTDAEGTTVAEALRQIGYLPTGEELLAGGIHRAFEVHIEQGPLLEEEGTDIGVVTGIQAFRWLDITLIGTSAHSGTTPAGRRRDALVAAAQLIRAVAELPGALDPDLRATVGSIQNWPNSRNVIPGSTSLQIDLRHPRPEVLEAATSALNDTLHTLREDSGIAAELTEVLNHPPVEFDDPTLRIIEASAQHLGLSHRRLPSGAGHDSMQLAALAPTAMLFIPCVDGVSHAEDESITHVWAVNGADALLYSVLTAADEDLAAANKVQATAHERKGH